MMYEHIQGLYITKNWTQEQLFDTEGNTMYFFYVHFCKKTKYAFFIQAIFMPLFV